MNTLSIVSLIHVSVLPPPFSDGMRCIANDFKEGLIFSFFFYSLNLKRKKKN
jgi:hypothetical protein